MNAWPLALIGYAPMLVYVHELPVRRAVAVGWATGCIFFAGLAHWLPPTVARFFDIGPTRAFAIFFAVITFEGARFAVVALLYKGLLAGRVPPGCSGVLSVIASDFLWPSFGTWQLATNLVDCPLLIQTAEVGGPTAVTFVGVCFNGACLQLIRDRWRPGKAALYLIVPVIALAFAVLRMQQYRDRGPGEMLRVAIVQGNVEPDEKRLGYGLQRYLELTRTLDSEFDLIVWPETVVTRAVDERFAPGWLYREFTHEFRSPVLFGAALQAAEAVPVTFYNSAIRTDRSGRIVERYNKRILVPFAERIPELVGSVRDWPLPQFRAGGDDQTMTLNGMPLLVSICYEAIWPGLIRDRVKAERPRLLVNLTNDAWFGVTTFAALHLSLDTLRAVEHRLYFVRAANTGISAVIDPLGRIDAAMGESRSGVLVANVRGDDSYTIYEAVGDWPWRMLAWATALGATFFMVRGKAPAMSLWLKLKALKPKRDGCSCP